MPSAVSQKQSAKAAPILKDSDFNWEDPLGIEGEAVIERRSRCVANHIEQDVKISAIVHRVHPDLPGAEGGHCGIGPFRGANNAIDDGRPDGDPGKNLHIRPGDARQCRAEHQNA
jgi:hypothetical protein